MMTIPLIAGTAIATAIGALASLGATAGSAIVEKKRSKQAQAYNTAMYDKQRADALADRAHEEAYNSPAQQRARLEQAGLQPQSFMDAPVASESRNMPSAPMADNPIADFSGTLNNAAGNAISNAGSLLELAKIPAEIRKSKADATTAEAAAGSAEKMVAAELQAKTSQNAQNLASIQEIQERCKVLKADRKYKEQATQFELTMQPLQRAALHLDNMLKTTQNLGAKMDNVLKRANLQTAIATAQEQLRSATLGNDLMESTNPWQAKLCAANYAKIYNDIASDKDYRAIAKNTQRREELKFYKTFDSLVQQAAAEAKITEKQAKYYVWNNVAQPIIGDVLDVAKIGVGLYGAGRIGSQMGNMVGSSPAAMMPELKAIEKYGVKMY